MTGAETRIGRSETADLVLPDSQVSRVHGVVRQEPDGRFSYTDQSANGSLVNGRSVGRGAPVEIGDGDVISVGPFELVVHQARVAAPPTAAPPPPAAWGANDLLNDFEAPPPPGPPPPAAPIAPPLPASGGLDDLVGPAAASTPNDDPLAALGGGLPPAAAPTPNAPPLSHGSPLGDSLPSDSGGGLPDDWDKSMLNWQNKGSAPAPPPAPAAPVAPAMSPLPEAPLPPAPAAPPPAPAAAPQQAAAAPTSAGLTSAVAADPARYAALLERVIDQLMQSLRARSEMKSEIRVNATLIQKIDNNPLKFCPTAPQALEIMLQNTPGYMNFEESLEEAFDDLRDHQVALVTSLRALFENVMSHFDPERLVEEWEETSGGGSLLAMAGRGKNWQHYEEHFARLKKDLDAAFGILVSGPFSETYSSQIQRLKRRRIKR